jgi:lysozyme
MNVKATAIIKHYESLHDGDLKTIGLQPKMCPSGIWTVGWGRALVDPITHKFLKGAADKKRAYSLYPGITEAQAQAWLEEDYTKREIIVRALVKSKLNDDQIGALTSFSYNAGVGALQTSTLLRLINLGRIEAAALELKKWNKGTNPRTGRLEVMPGLVYRRQSEELLFSKGELKFFNL